MDALNASVVIATRNRLPALQLSIPLLLSQSEPPIEVIVVDSSDNGDDVAGYIAEVQQTTDIPVTFMTGPRGSCHQRNAGAAEAKGEIIIFPDDDSLFYPTAIETMMRVYRADTGGQVAGVTLAAADRMPSVIEKTSNSPTSRSSSLRDLAATAFLFIERRIIRSPFKVLARELVKDREVPKAVAGQNVKLVADMEGFRMSFRAPFIQASPFNEAMTEYALGEDKDASYAAYPDQVILEVDSPLIYHHEYSGVRHNGFRKGVTEVLNQAYIVCRHTQQYAPARRAMNPYFTLLKFQIWLRSRDSYQADRLAGHKAARKCVIDLLNANSSELDRRYADRMHAILRSNAT